MRRKPLLYSALLIITALLPLAARPLARDDPFSKPDAARIHLMGQVEAVHPSAFLLNYGPARILIELDDQDAEDEASVLQPGEHVDVWGRVDADLFEERKIEADLVYTRLDHRLLRGDAADEETTYQPYTGEELLLTGTAVGAFGVIGHLDAHGLILSMEHGAIFVDVDGAEGSQFDRSAVDGLAVGDEVMVIGALDNHPDGHARLVARALSRVIDLALVDRTMIEP